MAPKKLALTGFAHPGKVESLAFAPDGQTLYSGSASRVVRAYGLDGAARAERALTKRSSYQLVLNLRPRPDGLGLGCMMRGWVLDPATLEVRFNSELGRRHNEGRIELLEVLPGGKDAIADVWGEGPSRISLDKRARRRWQYSSGSFRVSPDGRLAAVVRHWSEGEEIHLVDSETGELVREISTGKPYFTSTEPTWSADGRRLGTFVDDDYVIWSAKTGKPEHREPALKGPGWSRHRVVGADLDVLVILGADGAPSRLVTLGPPRAVRALPSGVTAAAISPDGRTVALGLDERIALVDVATGKPLAAAVAALG